MLESIPRSCMHDACNQRYEKSYTNVLTFLFKVNHQGQMSDFEFSEIVGIVNVRIDTKINSAACIQPELKKAIQ